MLSHKRNPKNVIEYADKKQHFSLRKLSVGVASVLLGFTFAAYGTSSVAHAAEPAQTTTGEQTPAKQAAEPATPVAPAAKATPAAKAAPAAPAERSEPASEMTYTDTVHFLYGTDHGPVVHAPVSQSGHAGDPLDKTRVDAAINDVLRAHPTWRVNNDGFHSQSKFAANTVDDNIIFLKATQATSTENVNGHNVASNTMTGSYGVDGHFQDWGTANFASHALTASEGQITGVTVQRANGRTAEFVNVDSYAAQLQTQLRQWITAHPGATVLPEITVTAPVVINFTTTNVPAVPSTVIVNFAFLTDARNAATAQTLRPALTLHGIAGEPFDNASVETAVNEILAAHPDWYVASSSFGGLTTYPEHQTEGSIFFAKAQQYTSHEYVNNDDVAQHTLTAQYDYSEIERNTGKEFRNWTPAAFADHAFTVPAGYHVVIRGVRVTAGALPTNDAVWPYTAKDKDEKDMNDYAATLQQQLSQWLATNPNATTLPSYTVNAPMDVRWDVELVADTPSQPDTPEPDTPPVTPNKPDKPNKPDTPDNNQPETPKPNKPSDNNKPSVPGQQNKPTTPSRTIATKPGQSASLLPVANNAASAVQTSSKAAPAKQAALPQTGANKAGVLGLALVSILAAFGLAPRRKHEN